MLPAELVSFYEVLQVTLSSLGEKASKTSSAASNADQADKIAMARDLATLLHSQCTKISIAARPPRTDEAVSACMKEIKKLLPLFTVLCQTLKPDKEGFAVCDTIKSQSRYALTGLKLLIEAVHEDPVSEDRLSRTGILWESCVELQKISTLSSLVSKKLRESTQMINDAIEDLESWAAGELDGNFDDFAGSGSDSDSDPENGPVSSSTDRNQDDAETERRMSMLKRIQLLLKAIDKHKTGATSSVSQLNEIYLSVGKLAVEIDDWAGEIQEEADAAFILEMEKVVVLRVQELLAATMVKNLDTNWGKWSNNFSSRWLEDVKRDNK